MAQKEACRKRAIEWNAANPLKRRGIQLKAKYGITLAEFDEMFAAQGRMCGCCGSTDPGYKHGWHIDHSHKTKGIRAILCRPCNTALGQVGDDPRRLSCMIKYLEKHSAPY